MSLWLLIPLLTFAAIIHSTLLSAISIAGYKLDFTLMLVVARGLTARRGDAFLWGLILGIVLDLLSGFPFGTFTFALTLIGALTALDEMDALRDNLIFIPVVMILATLLEHVLTLTILTLTNSQVTWSDNLLAVTLPSAILNTLAFPLIYFPVQWLAARTENRA